MTGRECYKIWAPFAQKWSGWVRPVPFINLEEEYNYFSHTMMDFEENPTPDFYLTQEFMNAAIMVDLPGSESVEEGIALAKRGFRPIPIFNGTYPQKGARATVDNETVGVALLWGAKKLSEIEMKEDAPPAFLMDTHRLNRYKVHVSMFDNSWDVYPQDLPTAEYFLKNDIKKVLVLGERLSVDLKKILYTYQKKGMTIWWTDGSRIPKKKRIIKSFF